MWGVTIQDKLLVAWRKGIAERLLFALRNSPDMEARGWGVRELTRAVAVRAKLSIHEDAAKGWLAGGEPRDPRVAVALAQVLHVDPGWLYFGGTSAAPAPAGYVPTKRLTIDGEVQTRGTPGQNRKGA